MGANTLREQIRLIAKMTEKDASGGVKETYVEEEGFRWAQVTPLPFSPEIFFKAKALKARTPSAGVGQTRYEITLRDQPMIPDLHQVLWKDKRLVPQSLPQETSAPGFVSFQACLYQKEGAS